MPGPRKSHAAALYNSDDDETPLSQLGKRKQPAPVSSEEKEETYGPCSYRDCRMRAPCAHVMFGRAYHAAKAMSRTLGSLEGATSQAAVSQAEAILVDLAKSERAYAVPSYAFDEDSDGNDEYDQPICYLHVVRGEIRNRAQALIDGASKRLKIDQ